MDSIENRITEFNRAINNLDRHFADFICRIAKNNDFLLYSAAALVSNALSNGNVCIDLASPDLFSSLDAMLPKNSLNTDLWITTLLNTSIVGNPGEYKPLIIEKTRLYLQKYWKYEKQLGDSIIDRLKTTKQFDKTVQISELISHFFPSSSLIEPDMQKQAALIAMKSNFVVISGGPGTGKTTTIAKIAALLLEYSNQKFCRIILAAPTGKAAAKLKKTISNALATFNVSIPIRSAISDLETVTIHRLLGVLPRSSYFKYNATNLLPYDVVIVDEASMIDLALMAKLFSAIPLDSKVILLGDKDQLASVEAGAILNDIYDYGIEIMDQKSAETATHPRPTDTENREKEDRVIAKLPFQCIIELTKNYRFPENTGIGRVSHAIRLGNSEEALKILEKKEYVDIVLHNTPPPTMLPQALHSIIIENYRHYLQEKDPFKALVLFDNFKVLCAVRKGNFGVLSINNCIERILETAGLIAPLSMYYPGRPIMVLSNDYNLGLYNGDVGIIMENHESKGTFNAFFPGEAPGSIRSFLPQLLPLHETVFAMTVHKSQGSEFNHVLILLPSFNSPLLSRELLYTAVTRAKKTCDIWSEKDILLKTIENRVKRTSGLREKLLVAAGK
jgi:exodeoxyribonuclease V alpha subunit